MKDNKNHIDLYKGFKKKIGTFATLAIISLAVLGASLGVQISKNTDIQREKELLKDIAIREEEIQEDYFNKVYEYLQNYNDGKYASRDDYYDELSKFYNQYEYQYIKELVLHKSTNESLKTKFAEMDNKIHSNEKSQNISTAIGVLSSFGFLSFAVSAVNIYTNMKLSEKRKYQDETCVRDY